MDRLELAHAYPDFMEQAEQQTIAGQLEIGQLFLTQGFEQGADMLERLPGIAASLVTRNRLDNGASGAPVRTINIAVLAAGQLDLGRHLFRLAEIVFGAQGQALALDWCYP